MLTFRRIDWASTHDVCRRKPATMETMDGPKPRELIILHGWHSLYSPLLPLENALRALPGADQYRFWRVTYDSHWKPFTQSAREIAALLRQRGVDPENTLIVAFSMGGLVARAMVSEGFKAHFVCCINTPHLGAVPWMPQGDLGSLSMSPWSSRLARLNRNPVDIAHRHRYAFFGIDFTDGTGYHPHDRIVMLKSSLGEGLEGVKEHHVTHLYYKILAPNCEPHVRGMNPKFVPIVLETVGRIFQN